jgi:putative spermidine/putrescine transport system ATP-binding protein
MSSPSGTGRAPIVTFSDIDKTYDGENYIIRDLNLAIQEGEFLSLLGPSGSGKTTTLMMLAGFEAPSKGDIRLKGERLNEQPPHRRNLGIVFQNYALFPHMTVAENVAFPLSVRGVPRARQQELVREALAMIELPHVSNRRPAQLSGGQQQRVALARAMVFEPQLILMDEPLGALDKRLRETMQVEIKRLHRRLGTTIVYVTHDQSEALTMSDRVAVFNEGAIQQIAVPSELYENPANAFVANFIGENNGLAGRVVEDGHGWAVLELGCGSRIKGRTGGGLRPDREAVLALRPERVMILDGERPDWNLMSGRVEDITYYGDHKRVQIAVANGQPFTLKVANTSTQATPGIGDRVRFGWPFADCKIVH